MEVDVPAGASGVLYALGGASGGVSLFLENGYLNYEYNLFIIERYRGRSSQPLPAGRHVIEVDTRVGQVRGPATVVISVDGVVVATVAHSSPRSIVLAVLGVSVALCVVGAWAHRNDDADDGDGDEDDGDGDDDATVEVMLKAERAGRRALAASVSVGLPRQILPTWCFRAKSFPVLDPFPPNLSCRAARFSRHIFCR